MNEKQEDELWWVRRLKELMKDFPEGVLEPNDDDPPDVFVKTASHRFGLEVKRLFRPSAPGEQVLQAREGNTMRITERARLIHLQAGRPLVRVSVFFNNSHIPAKDISRLSDALAEIVWRNLPPDGESRMEEYNYDNRSYFPDKIDRVDVHRMVPDHTWVAHEAAWSPDCGPDYLQRELDAKAARYAEAKRKCDEVWLLLVTNATPGLASHVCFTKGAFEEPYTTAYQRVFVIEFFETVHELCRKS